jgi:DNA-binding MarR family transcriptional regulator
LVMFSADSRRVFCYGYRRTLWDIEGRRQVADLGAYNGVERPAFSPNGRFLFATSRDSSVGPAGSMLWDCDTGQRQRRVGNEGIRVVFSPAGDRLLAFHGDMKEAQLWDFNAGQPLNELTVSGGGPLLDVRLIPGENKFLTLHGRALAVWDFASGTMLHARVDESLPFESRYDLQPAFFLGDKRRLITVHGTGAAVWEAAGGRLIHRLQTAGARCTAAIVGREPNTLLTVSPGGAAVLWDLETGQRRMVFGGVPADVFPAREEVWFSADGRRLFARHRAGQAIVAWDVGTGRIGRRYYLVNDGDDLLVELPLTGQFLGSPNAKTKVISGIEFHSLLELNRRDDGLLTFGNLADLLHVDRSSTSRSIERLRTRGHVEVRDDPHDRRKKVILLTALGRKEFERHDQEFHARERGVLAAIRPEVRLLVLAAYRVNAPSALPCSAATRPLPPAARAAPARPAASGTRTDARQSCRSPPADPPPAHANGSSKYRARHDPVSRCGRPAAPAVRPSAATAPARHAA